MSIDEGTDMLDTRINFITKNNKPRQSRYGSMLSNYGEQPTMSLMQFKQLPKRDLEIKRLSIENSSIE